MNECQSPFVTLQTTAQNLRNATGSRGVLFDRISS